MIFSRRTTAAVSVRLGDVDLEFTASHKYMGVWWDRSLSFSFHASQVRAKAWRL
jgi:hypothetical protein